MDVREFLNYVDHVEYVNVDILREVVKSIKPRSFWQYFRKYSLPNILSKCPETKYLLDCGLGLKDIKCHLYYDLELTPKYCPVCGKLMHIGGSFGYYDTCSTRCHAIYTLDERKGTCLKVYGKDNPLKNKEVAEKLSKKMKELYSDKEYKKETLAKRAQTCIEKYGKPHFLQTEKGQEKHRQSIFNKYGVYNILSHPDYIEKARETCNRRYGVNNILKSPIFRNKAKLTTFKHFGVDHYYKTKEFKEYLKVIKNDQSFERLVEQPFSEPMFTREEWNGHDGRTIYKWKCKICGEVFESITKSSNYYPRCRKCYTSHRSRYESEIIKIIESFGVDTLRNSRKILSPKELDIYIPSRNLAVEINGDFWHCTGRTDKFDHYDKTELCLSKGIYLIQIFESNWKSNKDQIVDKIKEHILGEFDPSKYYDLSKEVLEINRTWEPDVKYLLDLGYIITNKLEPSIIQSGRFECFDCGKYLLTKLE